MIQISNKVFYIGTNDRKKHLFENNWPLPNGSSTVRIPTTSPILKPLSADAT